MYDVHTYLKQFEKDVCYAESKGFETGRIVFVGNSGFNNWDPRSGNKAMEEQILNKDGTPAVWNHGIGGSTTEDQLYYYDRLIKKYQPRGLVLLSHANNISYGYYTHEMIMLLARLCEYARTDMPGIKIYVCDVRPLWATKDSDPWLNSVKQYNQMLDEYAARHDDVTVLKISQDPRFFEDGCVGDYTKPRFDIFVEDQVHLNQAGYDIFADFFTKGLDELL
jgi:lysophospholipase L1-like esterase